MGELLDCIAPLIDTWVIVDTGSTDGTQQLIRDHMASLGIAGELHERPWRDFGHNRSEALALCEGKADYALVLDADDLVMGDLDLSELDQDSYLLRYGVAFTYWRKQLFRLGLGWRYEGVVHEYAVSPPGTTQARLDGEYHVESRRLGGRSADPRKYEHDRDLLAPLVARDPSDARSTFYLAQSCFDGGDIETALHWYTRRVELTGWAEERFVSALRRGECMERLELPWAQTLEAYLQAFQIRPSRAEPLYAIACHYREQEQWDLGYLFASKAYALPFPDGDDLFVHAEVYRRHVRDELAVLAFHAGEMAESFAISGELLELDDLEPDDRERIAENRDLCVPDLIESSGRYPRDAVERLAARSREQIAGAGVTFSITACRRLPLFERTMNSFLNCCEDVDRIGRWICVDNGSSEADLERVAKLYPFLEVVRLDRSEGRQPEALNLIMGMVETPYWIHLEDDWHFFAPDRHVGRAIDILDDDDEIAQVSFNYAYGEIPADRRSAGPVLHRVGGSGRRYASHRYVPQESPQWPQLLAGLEANQRTTAFWPHYTLRPSLLRTAAMQSLGPFDPQPARFDPDNPRAFEQDYALRFEAAGMRTAFFDEIVALHIGRLTDRRDGVSEPDAVSAYDIADEDERARPEEPSGVLPQLDVTVMNLDRRPDRLRSFRAELERAAGPRFAARCRRFGSVDGQRLVLDAYQQWLFRDNDFGSRRGVVGCALTHLAVWQQVAAADRPRLILEDDVTLTDGFGERLEVALDLVEREADVVDVVQLGYFPWPDNAADDVLRPPEPVLMPMRWERFLGGTFAYVLFPGGARKLLEIADRDGIHKGIDFFVREQEGRVRTVELFPPIAESPLAFAGDGVDSDNQHDMTPVAVRGVVGRRRPLPVLADLVPSLRIGELRLDVVPQWPVTSTTIACADGGFSVLAQTEEPDGDRVTAYRVALDEDLQITRIEPLEAVDSEPDDLQVAGVDVAGGRLLLSDAREPGYAVSHRFVLQDAEGRAVAGSAAFTLVNGDIEGAEEIGAVVQRDDRLVMSFTIGRELSGLGVLELEEALALLRPD